MRYIPLLLLLAACNSSDSSEPEVTEFTVAGTVTDSIMGTVPDSVSLTINGNPVDVTARGFFIANVEGGPTQIVLTVPGYVELTRSVEIDQTTAIDLNPIRSRPALLSQAIGASSVTAQVYEAQGWSTVKIAGGGASESYATIRGANFTEFNPAGLGQWTRSQVSGTVAAVTLSHDNVASPIQTIEWHLGDDDGNVAVFFCTTTSCTED